MACAVGARLARTGVDVTLAGTWAAAIDAIGRRGILVHEVGAAETWSAQAAAQGIEALTASFPLAIVLVKSHQTTAAAAALAGVLEPSGLAVTLQNGLGNRETLAAVLGAAKVAAGVAIMGATLLGPGEVRCDRGHVVLGVSAATAERVACLSDLLRSAGIATETTSDVESAIWRKLVANCAINPLAALHGLPNGALLAEPSLEDQMIAAAREVGAVAAARRIPLASDPAEIARGVARATATNRSSMLQDLERGARTEIDAMSGAIVSEGRRLGVATPVNERLLRLVRAREGRPLAGEDRA